MNSDATCKHRKVKDQDRLSEPHSGVFLQDIHGVCGCLERSGLVIEIQVLLA